MYLIYNRCKPKTLCDVQINYAPIFNVLIIYSPLCNFKSS